MTEAILSLGSNLGDRLLFLQSAIKKIGEISGIELIEVSSFYETKPWGVSEQQNRYLNCCLKIKTKLDPFSLLECCLKVESDLGRTRPYKFAPRTIDIDVIAYGNLVVNEENLIIPHPRFKQRAFVLIPMGELCHDGSFYGIEFSDALKSCNRAEVSKLKQ